MLNYFKFHFEIASKIKKNITDNAIFYGFIISLTATLGSLFFSEIAGYDPCILCWYQRIFMYPLSVIFLVALLKKDYNVYIYTIPLSIIGSIIAGYHYYISKISITFSDTCSLNGTSCLVNYFLEFGYITFPLMALTSFIMIFIFSLALSRKRNY